MRNGNCEIVGHGGKVLHVTEQRFWELAGDGTIQLLSRKPLRGKLLSQPVACRKSDGETWITSQESLTANGSLRIATRQLVTFETAR